MFLSYPVVPGIKSSPPARPPSHEKSLHPEILEVQKSIAQIDQTVTDIYVAEQHTQNSEKIAHLSQEKNRLVTKLSLLKERELTRLEGIETRVATQANSVVELLTTAETAQQRQDLNQELRLLEKTLDGVRSSMDQLRGKKWEK